MTYTYVDQSVDLADILQSTAEDGEVRCKLGDSVTSEGIAPDCVVWGTDGFVSRPNDPDENGAAQAFYINDGNELTILGTKDNRYADKVATLDPGDRAIVSNSAARFFLKKEKDGLVLYTESKPNGGEAMIFDMDGENGEIFLGCAGSWIKLSNDEIQIGAAGGAAIVTIDKNGVQINGSSFVCATASGTLGILGTIAPPVGTNSILYGPTGVAGVPSSSWVVVP